MSQLKPQTKQLPLDAEATENETKRRHQEQELKAAILQVMSNLVHGRMSFFQNNEARGL